MWRAVHDCFDLTLRDDVAFAEVAKPMRLRGEVLDQDVNAHD
jgi:hypothetical protein